MSCAEMDDISENLDDNSFLEEEGFSQEEIDDLRDRVSAEQEKANLESWKLNEDEETRKLRQDVAKLAAIEEWHNDMHAKLAAMMVQIKEIRVREAAF